jgi:hypothetical protein
MTRAQFGVVSLALACGVAPPAHASTISLLAEFSRGATSIVDDGIGAALVPLQVVNNFDRTGLVQTFLTDGDLTTGNFAQAFAHVQFGIIRSVTSASSRDGIQKTATTESAFQDVLHIAGAGVDGATYRFIGAFAITGLISLPDTDPASLALAVVAAAYHWGAYQNDTLVQEANARYDRSSNGFEDGVNFVGTTIPVEFDFVWGVPIILEITLGGGAAAHSGSPGGFALASVDLGRSLTWLGASVQTVGGSPILSAITSESGTDWSQAAVPEPGAMVLMAIGASMAAAARRRRLRSIV